MITEQDLAEVAQGIANMYEYSLRDKFAMAALVGTLTRGPLPDTTQLARRCWMVADRMIQERGTYHE